MRAPSNFLYRRARQPEPRGIAARPGSSNFSWGQALVSASASLIAGLLGGVVGNVTVEAMKSQESLKRAALIEIYRPLRDAAAACSEKKLALAAQLKLVGLEIAVGSELATSAIQKAEPSAMSPPVGVKDYLESFGKRLEPINPMRTAARLCANDVRGRIDELATFLQIGPVVEGLRQTYNSRIAKASPAQPNAPKLEEYFSDSRKMAALIQAAIDGASGNVLRAEAARARVTKLVGELTLAINAEADRLLVEVQFEGEFYRDLANTAVPNIYERFSRPLWKNVLG